MKQLLAAVALCTVFAGCSTSMKPDSKQTVLFMCPYGGAKSVIAASYFNRFAQEAALPYTAIAVAAETPYDAVPTPVADFLDREGFDVRSFKPRHVASADVDGAAKVVSIGCELSSVDTGGAAVERWDDVPMVSENLPASAAAIRDHVAVLVNALR